MKKRKRPPQRMRKVMHYHSLFPATLGHCWNSIASNRAYICNMTSLFPGLRWKLAPTATISASISPVRAWIIMLISTIWELIISSAFITRLSLPSVPSPSSSWLWRVATEATTPSVMPLSAGQASRWLLGCGLWARRSNEICKKVPKSANITAQVKGCDALFRGFY